MGEFQQLFVNIVLLSETILELVYRYRKSVVLAIRPLMSCPTLESVRLHFHADSGATNLFQNLRDRSFIDLHKMLVTLVPKACGEWS
jgi:hypothetical protein